MITQGVGHDATQGIFVRGQISSIVPLPTSNREMGWSNQVSTKSGLGKGYKEEKEWKQDKNGVKFKGNQGFVIYLRCTTYQYLYEARVVLDRRSWMMDRGLPANLSTFQMILFQWWVGDSPMYKISYKVFWGVALDYPKSKGGLYHDWLIPVYKRKHERKKRKKKVPIKWQSCCEKLGRESRPQTSDQESRTKDGLRTGMYNCTMIKVAASNKVHIHDNWATMTWELEKKSRKWRAMTEMWVCFAMILVELNDL